MLYALEECDADTLSVPVLKVFDGDGFLTRIRSPSNKKVVEASVRFGFIDAPEMGQPGGREARDFLAKQIDGKWLDIAILLKSDTNSIMDRYGRIVAVPYLADPLPARASDLSVLERIKSLLFLQARNIELEMVLNGWAWVLDRYEPDERYFEALYDAQRSRRGIWARDDNVHPWEFKKRKYNQCQKRSAGTAV